MKKVCTTTLFVLYILFTGTTVLSQDKFSLSIGGTSEDQANSILQTRDGGYAIAGYTYNFGAIAHDMYIVKIDANGAIQWSRTVGGLDKEQAFEIIQTNDGGYAVAGFTKLLGINGDEDMYIVKLDSSGTLQWHRSISGFDFGDRNYDYANSLIQTSDGGYILAGSTWAPPVYINIYIVKLDANGNFLWSRIFGEEGSNIYVARSIIQTSDGGLALAGYSRHSLTDNFYIAKLDETGVVQWNTAIGGSLDERANAIIQTSDGGYAVAGQSLSFSFAGAHWVMYIVKLDSQGLVQWNRVVGTMGDDTANSIIQNSDGDYIVAGNAGPRPYIVKLDENGEILWAKSILSSETQSSGSVIQTSDGGFATAGFTYNSFTPSISNMYVLKFDSNGNTCENSTSDFLTNTGGTSFNPTPEYRFPSTLIVEPSPVIGSGGNVISVCNVVPVELISITFSIQGNNVLLNWITASEINNKGFEVQRKVGSLQSSVRNSDFKSVGFIEGSGTTTETNHYFFEDKNLSSGNYSYRLNQINFDGTFEYSYVIEVEISIPVEYTLSQNYPNPFNPSTTIEYNIPFNGFVSLIIYNSVGQEISTVVNEYQPSGKYSVTFSADKLPSGLYFYTLQAGDFKMTKKMILLK